MTKNNNIMPIALGVLCIVLSACLIASVASSSGKPDTSDLENQVTSLQNQVDDLTDAVNDYETQINDLTDENNEYASITNLEYSVVIIDDMTYTQDAGDETVLFDDTLNYAGYIELHAESTSDTTYIQVSYTYDDFTFNQTINLGNNGTAYFPILPETIKIVLGNNDSNTGTETIDTTVTLTYIY
jgi:cell division protein FtsB